MNNCLTFFATAISFFFADGSYIYVGVFFILKNETQLLLFSLIFQIEWYNHDKSATNNQFLIEKKNGVYI